MFLFVFNEQLKERLIKGRHRLIYEDYNNQKQPYWCFELKKQFHFSESDKEGLDYIVSNRMTF